MGRNPAFQFYPSDWSRDMIEHPLEVEGFWIRVCCILWWSSTRGTAVKPANIWAKTTAVSPQKCRLLFDYLLKHNIADIEVDKDIYKVTSRRMVRDEYIRDIRSKAGSLGGNPKIKGKANTEYLLNQNDEKQDESLVKQNPTPSVFCLLSSNSNTITPISPSEEIPEEPVPPKPKKEKKIETPMPEDFCISERVKKWAEAKNMNHLQEHFESFVLQCQAKGYRYIDWDSAFMNAITKDWAKIGSRTSSNGYSKSYTKVPPAVNLDEDVVRSR